MSNFSVEFDKAQIDEVRRLLSGIKNGAETAIRIALNDGLDKATSLAAKGMNETVTLTQSDIKSFFTTDRATNARPTASLRMRGESIPLIKYTNRQLSKGGKNAGVSVKVFRDESPTQYRHAFYATLKSGHTGIFMRREKEGGGYAKRLPIDEMRGPSVDNIYEKTPGLAAQVESQSAQQAIEELDRQVLVILNR